MAGGDPVITFACCWIAFNAFYAQDTADSTSTLERGLYRNYFYKILRLDRKRAIYGAIQDRSSGSVRVRPGNKYVYQPFRKGADGCRLLGNRATGRLASMETRFYNEQARIRGAPGRQETPLTLNPNPPKEGV